MMLRLLFAVTLIFLVPGLVLGLLTGGGEKLPLSTKARRLSRPTIAASPPRVQRHYQQWIWKTPRYGGREFQINYRVEGPVDGIPILLTHGFGANVNHFRFQFPALVEAGYRVYAMDLLGFGASEKPSDNPYSIDFFARQMTDFLQEHTPQQNQKSWILTGNSMGGLCTLAVAAQQEKSISPSFGILAIILFNAAGGMSGFRYKAVPAWAHPIMGHFQYFLLNPMFHGPFLSKLWPDAKL